MAALFLNVFIARLIPGCAISVAETELDFWTPGFSYVFQAMQCNFLSVVKVVPDGEITIINSK